LRLLAALFMAKVGRCRPGVLWSELTLILADDDGIQDINKQCLGRDESTDVLSLHYTPIPGEKMQHCAELIINVQRAIESGLKPPSPSRGDTVVAWGECRELALYIAHGCDHLTGANDGDHQGSLRMRRRELRWLSLAHEEGLIEGLLLPSG